MSTSIKVGDRVKLSSSPAYFKTADPMPMLRPPTVVKVGEEGLVVSRSPGSYWGVKFSQGIFWLEAEYLEIIEEPLGN